MLASPLASRITANIVFLVRLMKTKLLRCFKREKSHFSFFSQWGLARENSRASHISRAIYPVKVIFAVVKYPVVWETRSTLWRKQSEPLIRLLLERGGDRGIFGMYHAQGKGKLLQERNFAHKKETYCTVRLSLKFRAQLNSPLWPAIPN